MTPPYQFGDVASERHVPPLAVVDIGSNSVRLVVYEGGRRAPATLYNEKETAGLGRSVALSGKLDDDAIAAALGALGRFRVLVNNMGVGACSAVATAAVRDASNGDVFLERASGVLGSPVRVLSGAEEAEFSARGVLFGMPKGDGLVGDLGGGSLELVEISSGRIGEGETAPLGALRLASTNGDMKRLATYIDKNLAGMSVAGRGAGRDFFAVGGTWRALAKLHMEKTDYPLRVIEGYTLGAEQAVSLARDIRRAAPETLKAFDAVSQSRLKTLPYGALLLERLIKAILPGRIVFSAHGLRDGLMRAQLAKRIAGQDPLIAACRDFAGQRSRSLKHVAELSDWMTPVFTEGGETESKGERRLRDAACLLSDVAWRINPDYRAERALELIAVATFADIDHPGRAFVSLAVYHRHDHRLVHPRAAALAGLCDERGRLHARRIGTAIRLANALSAETAGIIPMTKLAFDGTTVRLTLPASLAELAGRRLNRRLGHLAQTLEAESEVVVEA